jgi:hypothetical protein
VIHATLAPSNARVRRRERAVTAQLLLLYCPACGRDCLAETPPCPDGHGEACPDRACVECGTALLLDAPLFALIAGARARRSRRAA